MSTVEEIFNRTVSPLDFAEMAQHHDWTACMSDSYAVTLAGERRFASLSAAAKAASEIDPIYGEIWDAAVGYFNKFTLATIDPEFARRWLTIYLALRFDCERDEITNADDFIFAEGEEDSYGREPIGFIKQQELHDFLKEHTGRGTWG